MADFEKAFRKTLRFEGGYVNNPNDSGGKTKYGITEKVARGYGYQGEMKNLPLNFARKVYKTGYWDANQLDHCPSQLLAENVFDCAVNCGVRTATKLLQQVLGATVDGVIGSETLDAVVKALETIGEKALVAAYLDGREVKYHGICANDQSQTKFLKGWLARCKKLRGDLA